MQRLGELFIVTMGQGYQKAPKEIPGLHLNFSCILCKKSTFSSCFSVSLTPARMGEGSDCGHLRTCGHRNIRCHGRVIVFSFMGNTKFPSGDCE